MVITAVLDVMDLDESWAAGTGVWVGPVKDQMIDGWRGNQKGGCIKL